MANEYFPMVDAYPQLKPLLEALPDTPMVTERWPRAQPESALIVVTEITNTHTRTSCVDALAYQFDLWSEDSNVLRRLVIGVDEVLSKMGFLRTLVQPEEDNAAAFRRIVRYSCKVDKRSMRVIQ